MTLKTIQKTGGIVLITGSIMIALWSLLWPILLPTEYRLSDFSRLVASPHWIWLAYLALTGVILIIFGLGAVYSRFYHESGLAGLAGYLLMTLSYVLQSIQLSWEIFIYPVIARNEASATLLRDKIILQSGHFQFFLIFFQASIFCGVLLFGISLIRSKIFRPVTGILLITGAVLYASGSLISEMLSVAGVYGIAAACFLMGSTLLAKEKQ